MTSNRDPLTADHKDADKALFGIVGALMFLFAIVLAFHFGTTRVEVRPETAAERECRLHDDNLRGSGREGATCAT